MKKLVVADHKELEQKFQTFLAKLEQKPYSNRSAEEIDTYIEEMRNSWDDAWDKEIAEDSQSGKFDALIQEVLEDHQAGKTTKLVNGLN